MPSVGKSGETNNPFADSSQTEPHQIADEAAGADDAGDEARSSRIRTASAIPDAETICVSSRPWRTETG